jgi:hypothetical protein
MRLGLENKAKVRWSCVFTGKFAVKCALCKKEKADFSRGDAETQGSGRKEEPQMDAD